MQTTNNRHLIKLGLMVMALAILVCGVPASVSASDSATDLVAGITFDRSVDDADIRFLKTSLQLLHDRLPVWHDYLEQAKPLVLSVDASLSAVGTVASAECCDTQSAGLITFGYHFGTFAATSEPQEQSIQARQIAFLDSFIHEATHVRDQRAGRLGKKIDAAACVIGEKAAFAQALDFKRAFASTRVADDPSVDKLYRFIAQEQVNAEQGILGNDQYWKRYCGLTQPQLMKDTDSMVELVDP